MNVICVSKKTWMGINRGTGREEVLGFFNRQNALIVTQATTPGINLACRLNCQYTPWVGCMLATGSLSFSACQATSTTSRLYLSTFLALSRKENKISTGSTLSLVTLWHWVMGQQGTKISYSHSAFQCNTLTHSDKIVQNISWSRIMRAIQKLGLWHFFATLLKCKIQTRD